MAKSTDLKSRHVLLRGDVRFDETNDHNPTLPDECPDCHGRGKRSYYRDPDERGIYTVQEYDTCRTCCGSKTTGQTVPYFDNDADPVDVAPDSAGWIRCPCCNWRFKPHDKNVWTGYRHARCGQRIRVIERA